MNISDELKAYMEQEFHKMVKDGNKLQDEREKYKKEWDKKRQRIEDERDKKLKDLSSLKDTIDNEQQYQSLKNRIIQKNCNDPFIMNAIKLNCSLTCEIRLSIGSC